MMKGGRLALPVRKAIWPVCIRKCRRISVYPSRGLPGMCTDFHLFLGKRKAPR